VPPNLYVLRDWREDALPTCSVRLCRREIQNGEPYYIPRGSILVVCRTCISRPDLREQLRPALVPRPKRVRPPRPPQPPRPPRPMPRERRQCPACDAWFWPSKQRPSTEAYCCSKSCARYHEQGKRQPNPSPCPWTLKWERCQGCGTTEKPHRGGGYCPKCYMQRRRA
jgi:hypothetical protein